MSSGQEDGEDDEWESADINVDVGEEAMADESFKSAQAPSEAGLGNSGKRQEEDGEEGEESLSVIVNGKITLNKDAILSLRPNAMPTKPGDLTLYEKGVTPNGGGGGGGGRGNSIVVVGWYNNRPAQIPLSPAGGGGGGGGGGHRGQDRGWSRGAAVNHQNQNRQGGGRRGRYNDNAVYKSLFGEIKDKEKKTETEIRAILNKLTPQKFAKLTEQLCEVQIGSNAMLDKLICLVFDKAVLEPNFANLYAEMCQALENKSKYWPFLQVAHNVDDDQYIWLKDMSVDVSEGLSGPYPSVEECVAACLAEDEPEVSEVTGAKPILEKIVISHGLLCFVYARPLVGEAAAAAGLEEGEDGGPVDFFVTSMDLSEVPLDRISSKGEELVYYPTAEEAKKVASKKNTFKKGLLLKCQEEFIKVVVRGEGTPWHDNQREIAELQAKRASFKDQEEYDWLMTEKEDLARGMKLRMLGNVRFIGELRKQDLVPVKIIFECLRLLMCKDDGFELKGRQDEYDVEMVCSMIKTLGAQLDTLKGKSFEAYGKIWKDMMTLLHSISKDKTYNARTRFSIEEVFAMRANKWQERRAQEGPATIEQIHKNAAADEAKKQREMDMQNRKGGGGMGKFGGGGGGGGGMMGGGNRGGAGDARQMGGSTKGGGGAAGITRGTDGSSRIGARLGSQNSIKGGGTGKGGTPLLKGASVAGMRGGGQTMIIGPGSKKKDTADVNTKSGKQDFQQERPEKKGGGDGGGNKSGGNTPPPRTSSASKLLDGGKCDGMADEERTKRANGMIEEYCRQASDLAELKLTLEELGPGVMRPMITKIMNKYVDCAKPAMQKLMEDFIQDATVGEWLSESRDEVEAGIKACELLEVLSDTVTDCKNAPEWLGKVVGLLVKAGACSNSTLLDLVQEDIHINVNELMCEQEVAMGYYNRFMDTVKSTSK
jgi:hypothetical protein